MASRSPFLGFEWPPLSDHQPHSARARAAAPRALRASQASEPAIAIQADVDWPIERRVGRLTFYPLAIGLFLLVDMALRATGH